MKRKNILSEYDIQANYFVEKTGVEIIFEYQGHRPYFEDEKEQRAVFNVTMKRGEQSFSFTFGASIMDSYALTGSWHGLPRCAIGSKGVPLVEYQRAIHLKNFKAATINPNKRIPIGGVDIFLVKRVPELSNYDVLACVEKYDPGTFAEWCGNLGYDPDSRKAEKIYFECQKQWSEIRWMFDDEELAELQDIN